MQTLIDLRYMYMHANAASMSVVLKPVVQIEAGFDSCKRHSNDRIACVVLRSHADFQRFWYRLQLQWGD